MNIIAEHKNVLLAVIGDIHGEYIEIQRKVKQYKLINTVIFQAGDFGIGFSSNDPREKRKDEKRLFNLNEYLKKRNIVVYAIRGNHDDPNFFDSMHNLTNIIFMQDYDVVKVNGKNIVGIGGAHSIDRNPTAILKDGFGHKIKCRRKDIDWWEDEPFVYNKQKVELLTEINIIVAHLSPDFVFPFVKGEHIEKWAPQDKTLISDIEKERNDMTLLYEQIIQRNNIELFVHGHFHNSNLDRVDGVNFWSLDINEFKEIEMRDN